MCLCARTHIHDASMGTDTSAPVNRMNLKRNMVYAEAFVCYFHIHMDARVAGIQNSSCTLRCEQMMVPEENPPVLARLLSN